MEVAIFLFAIVYLVIIVTGIAMALAWSERRKMGFFKATGVVLATLFVIYAIPFGDHTLGEIRKQQLCKEHGGVKVYQVAENVDGLMWRTGRIKKPYETFGYSFLEVQTEKDQIFRYEKNAEGFLEERRVDAPRARYFFRFLPEERLGAHHSLSKFVIVDLHQNKILASRGSVAYGGGWLGLLGSRSCPTQVFNAISFINTVLEPRELAK